MSQPFRDRTWGIVSLRTCIEVNKALADIDTHMPTSIHAVADIDKCVQTLHLLHCSVSVSHRTCSSSSATAPGLADTERIQKCRLPFRGLANTIYIRSGGLLFRVFVSRCGLAVRRLAGKQKDLGSIRFGSPSSSLQKLWFMDTVLWLCPHN